MCAVRPAATLTGAGVCLLPGLGWRYSVVLVMMSNTALLVTSTFCKHTQQEEQHERAVHPGGFGTFPRSYLFHFFEVIVQLGAFGSSNLLADFLWKHKESSLTSAVTDKTGIREQR